MKSLLIGILALGLTSNAIASDCTYRIYERSHVTPETIAVLSELGWKNDPGSTQTLYVEVLESRTGRVLNPIKILAGAYRYFNIKKRLLIGQDQTRELIAISAPFTIKYVTRYTEKLWLQHELIPKYSYEENEMAPPVLRESFPVCLRSEKTHLQD